MKRRKIIWIRILQFIKILWVIIWLPISLPLYILGYFWRYAQKHLHIGYDVACEYFDEKDEEEETQAFNSLTDAVLPEHND